MQFSKFFCKTIVFAICLNIYLPFGEYKNYVLKLYIDFDEGIYSHILHFFEIFSNRLFTLS